MPKVKDDFEKQLERNLNDPEFAKAFHEEYEKLKIALKIAELREKRGLTQKELAEKIHTTQSVISRLESSNYENYSIRTLKKVASALQAELILDFKFT